MPARRRPAPIAPSVELRPGAVVADRFRIHRILGRSRGLLLEAERTDFRQRVAIRVIAPVLAQGEKAVERFHREVRLLAQLESEYVARIVDVGRLPDHSLFLAREYLEGESIVEAARRGMSVEDAVVYVLQICEAVQEAHARGVVLRDLQPSNVFVSRRRNGETRAQLTDFGTCKVMRDPAARDEGSCTRLLGLSSSASPELLRHDPDLDERADVWSLGCLLYELIAGVPAFDGEGTHLMLAIAKDEPLPPSAIRRDISIPSLIDRVALGALSKRRDLRPRSVYHFALQLRGLAGHRGEALLAQIARLAGTTLPPLPRLDDSDDELTMVRPLRPSQPPSPRGHGSIDPMFPPAMPRPPMPSTIEAHGPPTQPIPLEIPGLGRPRMPWELPAPQSTPTLRLARSSSRATTAFAGLLVALTLGAVVAVAALLGSSPRRAEAGLSEGATIALEVPAATGAPATPLPTLAGGAEDLAPAPALDDPAPRAHVQPRQAAPEPPRRARPATPSPVKKQVPRAATKRGTLVAMAVGASCTFRIDGSSRGTSSSVRASLTPGVHTVGCQPVGGPGRVRRVTVKAGRASTAVFKF